MLGNHTKNNGTKFWGYTCINRTYLSGNTKHWSYEASAKRINRFISTFQSKYHHLSIIIVSDDYFFVFHASTNFDFRSFSHVLDETFLLREVDTVALSRIKKNQKLNRFLIFCAVWKFTRMCENYKIITKFLNESVPKALRGMSTSETRKNGPKLIKFIYSVKKCFFCLVLGFTHVCEIRNKKHCEWK